MQLVHRDVAMVTKEQARHKFAPGLQRNLDRGSKVEVLASFQDVVSCSLVWLGGDKVQMSQVGME